MVGDMYGDDRDKLYKLWKTDSCKQRACKRTDVLYAGMHGHVWRKRKITMQ